MLVSTLPQLVTTGRKVLAMINVFVWLLFGGLVGFAASRLIQSSQEATLLIQVAAGSLGALAGGVIFLIFDTSPLYAFTLGGMWAALVGAVVILGVVHMLIRRPI